MFRELDTVRIVKLQTPERWFDGTGGVARAPRVGDTGTIVHLSGAEGQTPELTVECVDADGYTVWLASFNPEELMVIHY
jgi:hypothetical protein